MYFIYSVRLPWESTHDLGVASTCSNSYIKNLQETTEILYINLEPFFCARVFLYVCVSDTPARESILHANVYQEIVVCDSFVVERMNFAEQHALV